MRENSNVVLSLVSHINLPQSDPVKVGYSQHVKNWSKFETLMFLQSLREADVISALDGKRQRNAVIFKGVARDLSKKGVNKPWEALRTKWKSLKAKYLAEKRESSRSGAGGGVRRFEYYEELDQILGSTPIVTARSTTIDSTVSPDEDPSDVMEEEEEDDDEKESGDSSARGSSTAMAEDSPVTPAAGGSGLFRRPLKKKVTPFQQVSQQLSDMLKRQERQDEADREMLQSLTSSIKRLVDCMERQQNPSTASPYGQLVNSQLSAPPFTYPHPTPSPYQHSFTYMQQQQSYTSSHSHSPEPHFTEL
ncbi:hypothetical protein ACEWY4_016858 [Coilia grayii]|uniref:Myb/SANT-like DNA-binding domain-containing protein n=1 Tax=Coilia grayii TaxID=363190 RepID=A0ABD1JN07_9TELE